MINQILLEMINYNAYDSKRINHALKVHSYSKIIGKSENLLEEELMTLEIASILHDIGIKECVIKYKSTNGFLQQIEGPKVAKQILKRYSLNDSIEKRILYLIGNHHSYKNIDGLDYQILLEADLIVNTQEGYISKYAFFNAVNILFKTESSKNIANLVIDKL